MISRNNDSRLIFCRALACQINYPVGKRNEAIGDVRGRGLLIGVEIVSDRETRNPDKERMSRISSRFFELGLNINRVGGPLSVWRIAPPLTITKSDVDQALEIMDEAFASA